MQAITEREFQQLAGFIKKNFGIYLKSEKSSLLMGRLGHMLQQHEFENFSEYYEYILADTSGEAVTSLVDRITTQYTYFMREKEHFIFLRDIALPFFEKTIRDWDLRIWSAGCSTGEEPYTLAILLAEYFKDKFAWDRRILATDISPRALSTAQKGIYEEKQLAPLPPMWKFQYFESLPDNQYKLIQGLQKEVIFKKLNLIGDSFVFKKPFHAIFCRNVMIYFDEADRRALIQKFYEVTAPGGYLFIGHSEAINKDESAYTYIMPAVYRKI